MPRTTPSEELQLIESIVAAHPNGIRISDIESEMVHRQSGTLNRRTLQRRLQKLIEAHRLTAEGESIALVYKVASSLAVAISGVAASVYVGVAEAELYISVSPEGARIRDQVRLPLMHLRPRHFEPLTG